MSEEIRKEVEDFAELMVKLKKAEDEIDNDPLFWGLLMGDLKARGQLALSIEKGDEM